MRFGTKALGLTAGVALLATLAVVGDTESDMAAGVAAGAGLVVGVRTGARSREALLAAGADEVLDSIAGLPDLLDRLGR